VSRIIPAFLFLASVCSAPAALADTTISYVGDLRTDATVLDCGQGCTLSALNSDADFAQYAAVIETFVVTAPSSMQAVTFSYGGGTNGAGMSIPEGGFEPYLSLFDGSGNFLASTFFGITCPAGANTNSVSGQCYDVLLDGGTLSPGTYQLAITAFENLSLAENYGTGTLADGFTGLGNLEPGENLDFAVDLTLGGSSTVTPEPGGLRLLLLALATLMYFGYRRYRRDRTIQPFRRMYSHLTHPQEEK